MPTTVLNSPTQVSNIILQKSFGGGIDTLSADSAIAEDAFQILLNARQRFGYIDPIKKHNLLQDAPAGKKQAIIGVGNIIIIFVAGAAYYKVQNVSVGWIPVPNAAMDATVSRIYFCAVPYTYNNGIRHAVANDATQITYAGYMSKNGIPSGIVVQDGITRPQLLTIDFANGAVIARNLKNFAGWNNTAVDGSDREYVPKGKQMLYHPSGIFLIVSPDGKQIYRSITGRPLDFMVNVDTNGDKLANEVVGGAATVSFAMDFDEVTLISEVNIPDSFVVGTGRNIRIVTFDYNNTIFGEPQFRQSAVIEAGVVNQYSWVEILGGYAFIDYEGVISFDAVQQLKFNGRNSIFSLQISKLLHNIRQENPCCTNFSNYSLFSLNTIWGSAVCVYDNIQQKWVAADVTEASNIVQFALTETTDATYIYAITSDDTVYQLYCLDATYTASLFTKAFVASETNTEHKAQHLRLLFNSGTVAGTVTVQEYVDGSVSQQAITKELVAAPEPVSIVPPFLQDTAQNVDNPSYALKDGKTGKKLAYIISWNNDAKLVEFELTTSFKKSDSSLRESSKKLQDVYAQ